MIAKVSNSARKNGIRRKSLGPIPFVCIRMGSGSFTYNSINQQFRWEIQKGDNTYMANTIKLGSLYLDNRPIETGTQYVPGQAIKIGDTITDKEISWVVVNGVLISDRCILTNVSWDELNTNELVFGKEITIDGYRYQVRLLKVGIELSQPNEWDAAVTFVGESNDLWHWENMFFWGQEALLIRQKFNHACRGYYMARTLNFMLPSDRYPCLGFRPVLVPLPTELLITDLIGQRLMLWSSQNIVYGCLDQVSDYDVVLSDWIGTVLGEPRFGQNIANGKLVVNRDPITGIQIQTIPT